MLPHLNPAVLMGFYFSPRGGSAQVARYLCRSLSDSRWAPTLFSGSLGPPSDISNAARFFDGIRCRSLDYTSACEAWARGSDPMSCDVPMHASFENKHGVPDRIFFSLDDASYERQVLSWKRFFVEHVTSVPSVIHLHHLTPMHEAVRSLWPSVPVIAHLHGTELKMLTAECDEGRLDSQLYVVPWVRRMRRWALDSDRLVVVTEQDGEIARDLLGVDQCHIDVIGNGVDTDIFRPRIRTDDARLAAWHEWLVDDPRGWKPGGPEGSIRYTADDLRAFTGANGDPLPVVLFAGRFLQFKRLQLLIEAHHAMQSAAGRRSVLVVAGGFPGEWEGEHPHETVRRLGVEGVFFLGWRGHSDLADILTCSDVFAAPSVDEPFGLVYLEAMAAGLPPIATNTGGPVTFINVDPDRPTGWLVDPDDLVATSHALDEAVSDRTLRTDRGRRASEFARKHYSWETAAQAFAQLYSDLIDEQPPTPT